MRSLHHRLARLEYQRLYQLAAKEGEPHGFTADQVLDEARRIFALPDPAQREALRGLYDELSEAEAKELDAIRHRSAAILRGMR